MGRMKENPRYNIISVRISDAELAELTSISNGRALSQLLLEALNDKIINHRQSRIDAVIKRHRA